VADMDERENSLNHEVISVANLLG